jgi:hypothetical protein
LERFVENKLEVFTTSSLLILTNLCAYIPGKRNIKKNTETIL